MKTFEIHHQQAIRHAKEYLFSEKELLTVLIEMDEKKEFHLLGYTGIFSYCMGALGFTESQAAYFSSVARKSREIPALKQAIDDGTLTISKARRIVSVITPATQDTWIEKAATLHQRELEREVAAVNPRSAQERIKAVDYNRHEIRMGLSEKAKQKLDRALALISKKQGRVSSLEETLEVLLDHFLRQKDPVRKAERTVSRKTAISSSNILGRRLPASVKHDVNLRDQGKCQMPGCQNQTWTEIHHKIPVAKGGVNTKENLMTLCSAHHRIIHSNGGLLQKCGKREGG